MKNLVFCLKAKKKSNHLEAFSPNIQSINRTNTHTHTSVLFKDGAGQGWCWKVLLVLHMDFLILRGWNTSSNQTLKDFFFFPLRPPPRVTSSPPPPYSPGDIFICRHRVCVCVASTCCELLMTAVSRAVLQLSGELSLRGACRREDTSADMSLRRGIYLL